MDNTQSEDIDIIFSLSSNTLTPTTKSDTITYSQSPSSSPDGNSITNTIVQFTQTATNTKHNKSNITNEKDETDETDETDKTDKRNKTKQANQNDEINEIDKTLYVIYF